MLAAPSTGLSSSLMWHISFSPCVCFYINLLSIHKTGTPDRICEVQSCYSIIQQWALPLIGWRPSKWCFVNLALGWKWLQTTRWSRVGVVIYLGGVALAVMTSLTNPNPIVIFFSLKKCDNFNRRKKYRKFKEDFYKDQINFLNSFKSMNRLSATQWISSPSCAHKLSPAHACSRSRRGERCRSSPQGAGHAFIFSSWKIRVILRGLPVCWSRAPAHSNRSSGLLQRGQFHPGTRLTWFVSPLFQPIKHACMCRVKRDHWR